MHVLKTQSEGLYTDLCGTWNRILVVYLAGYSVDCSFVPYNIAVYISVV